MEQVGMNPECERSRRMQMEHQGENANGVGGPEWERSRGENVNRAGIPNVIGVGERERSKEVRMPKLVVRWDYITSIEEAASRFSMEALMMAEGEGVFAESPTTVKEPIHCWMNSSKESLGLIGLGCTTLCGGCVRGVETLLTFEAAGKNMVHSIMDGSSVNRSLGEVLLLMASSLTIGIPEMAADCVREGLAKEQRLRQQRIAEITEMIHVASLLHDDVLDEADTRRGIGSLNFVMGNKHFLVVTSYFVLSTPSFNVAMFLKLPQNPKKPTLQCSDTQYRRADISCITVIGAGKLRTYIGRRLVDVGYKVISMDERLIKEGVDTKLCRISCSIWKFSCTSTTQNLMHHSSTGWKCRNQMEFHWAPLEELAVLAGDFLLSRASVALASLKNTEHVISNSDSVVYQDLRSTLKLWEGCFVLLTSEKQGLQCLVHLVPLGSSCSPIEGKSGGKKVGHPRSTVASRSGGKPGEIESR
eukprot:Gb_10265 [translate_table: standard]